MFFRFTIVAIAVVEFVKIVRNNENQCRDGAGTRPCEFAIRA